MIGFALRNTSIAIVGLALGASLALAQPRVYRCGQIYQQVPCAQGGKTIDANDGRSDAQRREAHAVASDESKLAGALERERGQHEREARPARAAGIGVHAAAPGAAASAPAKPKHRKKNAKAGNGAGEDFIAVEPGSGSRRKPRSAAR